MKLTPSERVGRGLAAAKTAVRSIIVDSFKATYGAALYEQRILEAIQSTVKVVNCTESSNILLQPLEPTSSSSTLPTTTNSTTFSDSTVSSFSSPSLSASTSDDLVGSSEALLNKKLISIGGPFEAVSKRMNLVTLLRILKQPVVWMICKSYATATQSHSFVTFEECNRIATVFQQWSAQELDIQESPSSPCDEQEAGADDTSQQTHSLHSESPPVLGVEEENILSYCKQCIIKCFQFIYRLGYSEQAFKFLQEHQEFALTTLSSSPFGASSSLSLSAISTSSPTVPLNIASSLTASFFTDSENKNSLLMLDPQNVNASITDSISSVSESIPQLPQSSNNRESSHLEFKRVTYDFQPSLNDNKHPLDILRESLQSLKENLELVLFGDQSKQQPKKTQVTKAAELATISPHQLVCKEQTYVMDEQMDLKQQFELRMKILDFKVKKTAQKKKQQTKEQESATKSTGVSFFFN